MTSEVFLLLFSGNVCVKLLLSLLLIWVCLFWTLKLHIQFVVIGPFKLSVSSWLSFGSLSFPGIVHFFQVVQFVIIKIVAVFLSYSAEYFVLSSALFLILMTYNFFFSFVILLRGLLISLTFLPPRTNLFPPTF
jgi:hypothetical protein